MKTSRNDQPEVRIDSFNEFGVKESIAEADADVAFGNFQLGHTFLTEKPPEFQSASRRQDDIAVTAAFLHFLFDKGKTLPIRGSSRQNAALDREQNALKRFAGTVLADRVGNIVDHTAQFRLGQTNLPFGFKQRIIREVDRIKTFQQKFRAAAFDRGMVIVAAVDFNLVALELGDQSQQTFCRKRGHSGIFDIGTEFRADCNFQIGRFQIQNIVLSLKPDVVEDRQNRSAADDIADLLQMCQQCFFSNGAFHFMASFHCFLRSNTLFEHKNRATAVRMDGGKSEGRTKYYIVSINRHGIHTPGIEIDVESTVVETAFAEKPPDQFEFSGCEPLIHEQLLNGK